MVVVGFHYGSRSSWVLGWGFSVKKLEGRLSKEEVRDVKSWTSSCSAKSCLCLGMLIVGFEGEIMKLLEKMKKGKEQR